jgi:palmitoyl-protein thioesterase
LVAAAAAREFTLEEFAGGAQVDGDAPFKLDTPIVFAHGMGDSCFNPGMSQITKETGTRYGTYSVCIPDGARGSDASKSFFSDYEDIIDDFAQKVQADAKLKAAKKINAVGLSQGNSIIRGYVQKYNLNPDYPQVENWVSVHGPLLGVSGFPHCKPGTNSSFCDLVAKFLGVPAYWELTQKHLVQAGYYRLPTKVDSDEFKKNSRVARLNGESTASVSPSMDDQKKNFASLNQLTLVKADKDTMVAPNDSEWFGYFKDGSLKTEDIQQMKDTKFYQQNLFGLADLDKKGAISFEETAGDHLQFTIDQLFSWTDKSFKPASQVVV